MHYFDALLSLPTSAASKGKAATIINLQGGKMVSYSKIGELLFGGCSRLFRQKRGGAENNIFLHLGETSNGRPGRSSKTLGRETGLELSWVEEDAYDAGYQAGWQDGYNFAHQERDREKELDYESEL